MATKYALVLSGGGFKGAFQVGALDYLNRNWKKLTGSDEPMKFDIISGVSVGALNGAMVAMNKLDKLKKIWNDVGKNGVSEFYTSDFIDTDPKNSTLKFKFDLDLIKKTFLPNVNFNFGLLQLFSIKKAINNKLVEIETDLKNSLRSFKNIADNTPLRNKLVKYLKRDEFVCPFYCGFVDLEEGEYNAVLYSDFTTDEDFVNGVLGSATMPIVWSPVKEINFLSKQKRNVIDGGVRNNSPLGDVIKFIQDASHRASDYLIIVINCNSGTVTQKQFGNANIG